MQTPLRELEALALGALMAALSALVFVVLRVPVFIVCCTFPLIYAGLRAGLRTACLAAGVASCLVAILLGPIAGLHFAIPFGLMGPPLAWMLRRPAISFRHLFALAVGTGAALLMKVAFLFWLIGKTGALRSALDAALRWGLGRELGSLLGRLLLEAPIALPVAVSLSDSFVTLMLAVHFLRRIGIAAPEAPRPADFRLGPASILVFLASWQMLRSPLWGWIGANLLLMVSLAYHTLALGTAQEILERTVQRESYAFSLLWLATIPFYPATIAAGLVLSLAGKKKLPHLDQVGQPLSS